MVCQNFIYLLREPAFGFLNFCYALFCFFCIYSALYFTISFLLLTLGLFISSFSSCFRYRVRLFIWFFSCFLRYPYISMNLPFNTTFTVSTGFGLLCFHFHLFLCIFWLLFLFLLWFVGYSAAYCSASISWHF